MYSTLSVVLEQLYKKKMNVYHNFILNIWKWRHRKVNVKCSDIGCKYRSILALMTIHKAHNKMVI